MPLLPPSTFATVEEGVYRSATPQHANLEYLDTLGLRTILLLTNEPLEGKVAKHFKKAQEELKVVELGKEAWVPDPKWTGVGEDLVKRAVECILDRRNHPLLVCCTRGYHITGVVIACLRKTQQWAKSSILSEYRTYASPLHRISLMHFIDNFHVDVISAPHAHLPDWYARQLEQEAEEEELFQTWDEKPKDYLYESHLFSICGPVISVKLPYDFKDVTVDDD
eukprot:TRINITY_DN11518_c0_g2_i1.p2 TRINITY_DN11518_c0_g2~~TRINITY_DN11518_c0_g2_i1.p2  ORF type:complete len:223 (+),score=76.91 TRINITY_DN11518_c0_g2_i1:206-874(+)